MGHPPPPIGELLVSARTADEYLAMFDLDLGALAGRRVLDCPGGAAAFVAAAAGAGAHAVGVDPVYALDPDELLAHARAESRRGTAYSRANRERFVWDHFLDPDNHDRRRMDSIDRFGRDLEVAPERYVAGWLPDLPFADRAFDLATCSHLLFTYDDRLDLDFHLAALRELLRVADEVRVFPTLSMRFERSDLVDPVVAALRDEGVEVATRRVAYEFQRGGNELLLARRPGAGSQ